MSTQTSTCYYGPTEGENARSIDLYLPAQANEDSPLIVFIHGGAWRTEDKADYQQLCTGFSELGYACASINYRLSLKENGEQPTIQHPDHINDAGKAVEFLYKNSSGRYDAKKLYLVGHSAGAHIALMLLLDNNLPYHDYVKGVIGVSGIYDIPLLVKTFPSYLDFIEQGFGSDQSIYYEASPISKTSNVLSKKPVIIAHSQDDTLINNDQAHVMHQHLKSFHQDHTILDMSLKGDHYDIMTTENLEKLVKSLLK
ncbi:Alpha/Beta hydrolase protein [Parasitella parasitica]|nr:Alpha/Beta hydrolase protein [Parasitella parasitica]